MLTTPTDEPRRSGRATKGQHKNASSSPAPMPKPSKTAKTKPAKKSSEPEAEEEDDDEGENEDRIRCICGNEDSKDKRAFIGCDACTVWQHNVCMGMPIEEDDVPDHYFCEDCRPDDHVETMQALNRGDRIWETRNRIWQNEKKSKSRKSKGGRDFKPGWLKKDGDLIDESMVETLQEVTEVETGTKRKLEETKETMEEEEVPKRPSRQDKRHKSSSAAPKEELDTDTALVEIDSLPADRQKPARALSKAIAEDVTRRVASGYRIPDGHTAKSLGDYYAARIEYALHINHSGQPAYKQQFLALNANFKSNKMLIERLLNDSLTADDLATMDSKDMASEQLQRERADLKKELDRQATAIVEEGPRIRRTHKGDEVIENEAHVAPDMVANAQPVRERASVAEDGDGAGSAANAGVHGHSGSPSQSSHTLVLDTREMPDMGNRRSSSQQFDTNDIWAKTAHSPTLPQGGSRPMQMPPRRRSSVHAPSDPTDGAKHDPDIDRMLEDNDEPYSPADYTGDDSIVWRGKLAQGEGEPTVNARFVAGRVSTAPWSSLLPSKLFIDGRLAIQKAEEYLCGLQWSNNSDVSVLALTAYDDADAFNTLFEYFETRKRYAVVTPKHLPSLIKDLYIVPVNAGGSLPEHVGKLDLCKLKTPVEERLLLATFVIARAPDGTQGSLQESTPIPSSGSNGHHLPQHIRTGPAGSPIAPQTPVFSAPSNGQGQSAEYGGPHAFPPNPYGPTPAQQSPEMYSQPQQQQQQNSLAAQILGGLYNCPTAVQVLAAEPNINREKLENLRKILEQQPEARTNIEALAKQLIAGT